MLVATFGPSTAWQGREIVWDLDHFILVGHGAIPAAGLLDYDRRGQLVWADPAYPMWVAAVDRWERGGATARPAARARPRGGVPAWAIVVAVVAAVALVAAVVLVAFAPSAVRHTTQTLGQDMVVRANVYTLRAGIESYAADHDGRFPGPGEVGPAGMSRYIATWPENPYTGAPMADGGGEGNFRYDLSPDGGAYKIIGYGSGGGAVIELGGGAADTV
jgi:hypothetical protein